MLGFLNSSSNSLFCLHFYFFLLSGRLPELHLSNLPLYLQKAFIFFRLSFYFLFCLSLPNNTMFPFHGCYSLRLRDFFVCQDFLVLYIDCFPLFLCFGLFQEIFLIYWFSTVYSILRGLNKKGCLKLCVLW